MVRGAASLDFCGVYTQFSVAMGYDDSRPAAAYNIFPHRLILASPNERELSGGRQIVA